MNTWLTPWWEYFKGPLSGDVTQDINPVTSWLSPQVEFNFAGDRQLESDIVTKVASYGKQLGILSDAVLELASGKQGEAVVQLQALVSDVNEMKQEHNSKLECKIKSELDQLKRQDPEALTRLLSEYQ